MNEQEIISLASNIKPFTSNPSYTKETFLATHPQFANLVPESIIVFYVNLANHSLSYARWGESWEMGMTLFIAHYLTLYLMATANMGADPIASQVISHSIAQGQVASKSAGSLSKSYDYGSVDNDLNGWGAWKLTFFGQQFATIAKLIGKGGSYIW